MASAPLPLVVAALWAFALVRGGVYYLVGHLALGRPGGRLEPLAQRLTRGHMETAKGRIEQIGPVAIILTYPIYGLSGAVQVVSGGLGMRLIPFFLALGVVSLAWASLQAVIGITAFAAIAEGAWLVVLGGALVLGGCGWLLRRRHLSRLRRPDSRDAA